MKDWLLAFVAAAFLVGFTLWSTYIFFIAWEFV